MKAYYGSSYRDFSNCHVSLLILQESGTIFDLKPPLEKITGQVSLSPNLAITLSLTLMMALSFFYLEISGGFIDI